MITIRVPDIELFNGETQEFEVLPGREFRFEHSLKAISLWESKWCKPFLSKLPSHKKTTEELVDYYRCMCLDDGFTDEYLTYEVQSKLAEYLQTSHTATTFRETPNQGIDLTVHTSEVLYAYMAIAGIPFEADTWNFERLSVLIRAVGELNQPKKKMSNSEILQQNRELNEMRKAKLKSGG